MAKATVKNTRSGKGNISHQGLGTPSPDLDGSFLVDFQEFSQNLHVFRAKDCGHELLCEMVLEVRETFVAGAEGESYLAPIVACSFPPLSLQKLNGKTGFDNYLPGILMFQFQLKILGQLFLFCEGKNAIRLILTVNNADLGHLEIYSRFLVSQEHVKGDQTQLVIPTDVDTYGEIIDFMDELDKNFRKILWREHNANPAFRDYLKEHSLFVV